MYTIEEVITLALEKNLDNAKDIPMLKDVAIKDVDKFTEGAIEMIASILGVSIGAEDLHRDDPAFIAGVISVALPFLTNKTIMSISTMICDIAHKRESPYKGTTIYEALSDMDFPDDQPVGK